MLWGWVLDVVTLVLAVASLAVWQRTITAPDG